MRVFFFLGLFATVAQVGGGTAGGGLEEGGGAEGAGVDPGLEAGEGDGGDSVAASFKTWISSLSALIWAQRLFVSSVYSFCISVKKPRTRRSGLSVVQYSVGSTFCSVIACAILRVQ